MFSYRKHSSVAWLLFGASLAFACGDDATSSDDVLDDSSDDDTDAGTDDTTVTDDSSDDETDEATSDDTSKPSSAAGACYMPEEHVCDCELNEGACTESGGIWTEMCTSCAQSDGTDDESETDEQATNDDAGTATNVDAGAPQGDDHAASDDATDPDDTDSADDDPLTDDGSDAGPSSATDGGAEPAPEPEPEPEPEFQPIRDLGSTLLPQVNDLRGLTFAHDGKIYATGHVGASTDVDRTLAVLRFNADGTPDESFGTGGLVTHNLVQRVVEDETVLNDGDEQSFGIVELQSGELLVTANVRDAAGLGGDIALVKLDAAGALVPAFGTGGVLRVDLGWMPEDDASWPQEDSGPRDQAWDLQLDTTGDVEKIVLFAHGPAPAGALQDAEDPTTQRTDNDRYVVRLLASDGSIDPSFNQGAAFNLNSGGTFSDGGRRGRVLEDGSILSAGYTNFGAGLGNHVLVIRLLPSGLPDPSFGFGIGLPGVVRTNPFIDDGGVAECYSVGLQSTGRYVTTGYGRATGAGQSSRLGWVSTDSVDLVSVGFGPRGVDQNYGSEATFVVQSEEFALGDTEDRGRDLVVLPDDRVVHVGKFGVAPAIFVSLPDGQMDLDSGVDGRFEYPALTERTSHFFKVALSADGQTIVATTSNHADGVLFAMLKVGSEG